MKIDIDELDSVYNKCESSGYIKEKNEVDIELIKSLKKVSLKGLEFTKEKEKTLERNSEYWTFVFRDYYESLRSLIDAYLLFDKVEVERHQCTNAYICHHHPELELNWEFLEKVRLKRNAINYRGQLLDAKDWKKFKIEFDLHINKLKREIEKRLEKFNRYE